MSVFGCTALSANARGADESVREILKRQTQELLDAIAPGRWQAVVERPILPGHTLA